MYSDTLLHRWAIQTYLYTVNINAFNTDGSFTVANSIKLSLSLLRKHTYSNILKISPPITENFQKKKSYDIFHISAQNIFEQK